MRRVLSYLKPYTKECIIGPAFKLLEAILELLLPTIMALIINNGVANRDAAYVIRMGALMLGMSLLGICSSCVCQYLGSKTSQGYGTALRNAVFHKIGSFSQKDFDRFGTSSLTNRVTNDIGQLQFAVAMLIRLVIRAPFICIGAIVMAMLLNLKLSLVLIAASPAIALILYAVISKSAPQYTHVQKMMDRLSTVLRENLSGVRVVRAFAKTKDERTRFAASNDELTKSALRVARLSSLLNPMTSFVLNIAIVVVLWFGNIYIDAGSMSQGTLLAFINYLTQMLIAMIVVSNLVVIFTKAYASAKRVEEVLAAESVTDEGKIEMDQLPDGVPAIAFENVSFAYGKDEEYAVENISFTIEKGEKVGITGVTGSGKSTVIGLLGRFYETTEGSIKIGGAKLREHKLSSLRRLIGLVPQRTELFAGTIADNIARGNRNASKQEIEAAACAAQAAGFIGVMPAGYDTVLQRGGAGLSGGQKQRVSIARALVRKPEILILDDSTSALDYATEADLRKALERFGAGMTQLIISQRISSIRHCDRILVLDDGKLADIGTHDALLQTCPVYGEICRSQSGGEGETNGK